jgi:hypothetical protein
MIDFLFLTLPSNLILNLGSLTYQNLIKPQIFSEELQPYACWAFK